MSGQRFAGKVAVVTGGSSGIGQRVSELLAAEGASVAVVASSNMEKAEAVADGIRAAGGVARAFVADVRHFDACAAVASEVEEIFGGVDLLVCAAGVFYPTPVGDTPPEDAERLIAINLGGQWNAINACVPAMRRRGGGRIVNLASVAGIVGFGGLSLYCATKAATVMMTRALAGELAPDGIAVNAVAPGNTATPMNAAIRADQATYDAMARITPSQTVFSDPDDIAEIILFQLSDAARPVHGATWLADEGVSAVLG